ncbi:MAG: SRPBCC domain-containing protein [Terriglobia bacterium]
MKANRTSTDGNSTAVFSIPTRRQALAGVAIAFGSLTLGSIGAGAEAEGELSHAAEAIHQEPVFKASRKRVYEALTDTQQFNKVTQIIAAKEPSISLEKSPTQISREAGGTFVLFGAIIVGRHIELVPNQRIVQAWRVAFWDPGIYSIAKFELTEQGDGTKIIFDHTGFPKGTGEHLAAGWKAHYWEPLAQFLG